MNNEWNALLSNIHGGFPVELSFFKNDNPTSSSIRSLILSLLQYYNKNELHDALSFYVSTLVHNAVNINVKNAFFRTNNLELNNLSQYVNGLTKFRTINGKDDLNQYYNMLKDLDLWIKFKVSHSKDGISLEVINNSPIPDVEEMWMRTKLKKSMMYNELINNKEMQNANLEIGDPGIGLIAILMKEANLDARLFRIGSRNGVTVSRIEVPFTEQYQPVRRYIKV